MIYITDVTIHEKVKIIGQRSFKDCLGLDFYIQEKERKGLEMNLLKDA